MDALANIFTTLFNLGLVIVGFGLIVFIHELGHFLAAKWAGIRVLAFALGMGPAVCSYRKGMGMRRGSSERDYLELLRREPDKAATCSPTEYRLNALPLGGYVKMLGQEDLNPSATSAAPDSYGMCHPAKRMVVISAGVVLNLVLAGLLFVAVFLIGLERQPPVIGAITPGGAASSSVAAASSDLPEDQRGLLPGDRVIGVDGRRPSTFDDLILAAAMGTRDRAINLLVEREGLDRTLEFQIQPRPGMFDGLLDLGLEPMRSTRLLSFRSERQNEQFTGTLATLGLAGVEPGSTLVSAAGRPVASAHDLDQIVRESGGAPLTLVFRADQGAEARVEITPIAELERAFLPGSAGAVVEVQHLLGLMPVMMVEEASPDSRGFAQGLRTGDVFERIGTVEFPSLADGIAQIKASRGREIQIVVRRPVDPGVMAHDEDLDRRAFERVTIRASVKRDGTIGFVPGTTEDLDTLVALPVDRLIPPRADAEAFTPAAARIIERPGARITAVGGAPVATFTELREALRERTAGAAAGLGEGFGAATVTLTISHERADGATEPRDVEWTLTPTEVRALHELSWTPKFALGVFELESFTLKADSPGDAIATGLHETHRVMMSTYLTLLRLFQGTVRVEHLKGPVGITHMGTVIADRGLVWLMFFFALVSVNLAVINFLPLPIVDGGQFLMLIYEWIRGKPVPVGLQNAMTLAGLLLIGSVFIIVTFNDVARLIGG